MQHRGTAQLGEQERLFLSLVEQLSQPLLQIARLSELAGSATAAIEGDSTSGGASVRPVASVGPDAHWALVQAIAGSSLQLAESYALSLRVHGRITPLEIEPVNVSSLLYDTAQALQQYARQYGVELELDPGPKMQPVLGDRTVLQAALTSLGQVFVRSQAESDEPMPVCLSAHRSRYGVVAGLYGNAQGLGADSLRRAWALGGTARQPLQRLASGPAAGVFVADSLLQALATRLHAARYHNLTGLAATLPPSQQLQLV